MRGVPPPDDFSRVITGRINVLITAVSDNPTDEVGLHSCLIIKNKESTSFQFLGIVRRRKLVFASL